MPKTKKSQLDWYLYKASDGQVYPERECYIFINEGNGWRKQDLSTNQIDPRDGEFVSTLKFERSMPSYYACLFRDLKTNRLFVIRLADADPIFANCLMNNGLVYGRWGWVQRKNHNGDDKVYFVLLKELDSDETELDGVDD